MNKTDTTVLNYLFRYAIVGMALLDIENRFIMVNKSLLQMLGYTEDELVGKTWMSITHPDDLNMSMEYLLGHLKTPSADEIMEKRYLHKNGQPVYVRIRTNIFEFPQG